MKYAEIKRVLEERPFQPFRIHMSGGRSFDVKHPELAANTINAVYVFKPAAQDVSIPESLMAICSAENIATIEPLRGTAA